MPSAPREAGISGNCHVAKSATETHVWKDSLRPHDEEVAWLGSGGDRSETHLLHQSPPFQK